jgi:hypothetical protein
MRQITEKEIGGVAPAFMQGIGSVSETRGVGEENALARHLPNEWQNSSRWERKEGD